MKSKLYWGIFVTDVYKIIFRKLRKVLFNIFCGLKRTMDDLIVGYSSSRHQVVQP
jgi:hypothetical protein